MGRRAPPSVNTLARDTQSTDFDHDVEYAGAAFSGTSDIDALQRRVARLRRLRERISDSDRASVNPTGTTGGRDRRLQVDTALEVGGVAGDVIGQGEERFERLLRLARAEGRRDGSATIAARARPGQTGAATQTRNAGLDAEAHLPTSTTRRDREARHRLAHIRSRAPSPAVLQSQQQGDGDRERRVHVGLPATNMEVIRKNGPPVVVRSATPTPVSLSPQIDALAGSNAEDGSLEDTPPPRDGSRPASAMPTDMPIAGNGTAAPLSRTPGPPSELSSTNAPVPDRAIAEGWISPPSPSAAERGLQAAGNGADPSTGDPDGQPHAGTLMRALDSDANSTTAVSTLGTALLAAARPDHSSDRPDQAEQRTGGETAPAAHSHVESDQLGLYPESWHWGGPPPTYMRVWRNGQFERIPWAPTSTSTSTSADGAATAPTTGAASTGDSMMDESLTRRGQRVMRSFAPAARTTPGSTSSPHPREGGHSLPGNSARTADRHSHRTGSNTRVTPDHRPAIDPSRTDADNLSAAERALTFEAAQRELEDAREARIQAHERYLAIQHSTRPLLTPLPGGGSTISNSLAATAGPRTAEAIEARLGRARDALVAAQLRESRAVATREWARSPLREVTPPIIPGVVGPATRQYLESRQRNSDLRALVMAQQAPATGIRRTIEITSNSTDDHAAGTRQRDHAPGNLIHIIDATLYPPRGTGTTSINSIPGFGFGTNQLPAPIPVDSQIQSNLLDRTAVTHELMEAEERLDLAMAEANDRHSRWPEVAEGELEIDAASEDAVSEAVEAAWDLAEARSRASALLGPEGAEVADPEGTRRAVAVEQAPQTQLAEGAAGAVAAVGAGADTDVGAEGDASSQATVSADAIDQAAQTQATPAVRSGEIPQVVQQLPQAADTAHTLEDNTATIDPRAFGLGSTSRSDSARSGGNTRSRRLPRDRLLAEANALVPQLGRGLPGRIVTMEGNGQVAAAGAEEGAGSAGVGYAPATQAADYERRVPRPAYLTTPESESENDSSSEEEDDDESDDDVGSEEHNEGGHEHNESYEHDYNADLTAANNAVAVVASTETLRPAAAITGAGPRSANGARSGITETVTHTSPGKTVTKGKGEKLHAHVWPAPHAPKQRKHRPYVSLLDL